VSRRPVATALVAGVLAAAAACAAAPVPVLVFAGAACKPVLDDATIELRRDLGLDLEVSAGGSGTVLTQIELARKGDIYMPGSQDYMARAVARGLVDPTTRVDFAWLTPALLVAAGNPKGIHTLADLARSDVRAAIGEPRTVCVGEYAVRILDRAGLTTTVLPRLARAHSCEALATLVGIGSVDVILGWDVFASWFPGRVDVVPLPARLLQGDATIPGAVTVFAAHPAAARRVLAWLSGPRGRAIWHRHGYRTEPVPTPPP
jgi:molybdate transport system substrate-binding protein